MGKSDIQPGAVFGLWTVIQRSPSGKDRKRKYLCVCACGEKRTVYASKLRSGKSKSCRSCAKTAHGKSRTRVYHIWQGMIQRCHTPTCSAYADYGGKGIRVCEEWRVSRKGFMAFYAHVGDQPDTKIKWSIDRINPYGNYEPGNVRWATPTQQAANRRLLFSLRWNQEKLSEEEYDEAREKAREWYQNLQSLPNELSPF